MFIPPWLKVYGDVDYRNKRCKKERVDQMDFMSWVARNYPEYYPLVFHPKMEGKRNMFQQMLDKKMGSMKAGVADVVAIGFPCLVMELKRADHKESYWSDGQLAFLERASKAGAYTCLALGFEGAKAAFSDWVELQDAVK